MKNQGFIASLISLAVVASACGTTGSYISTKEYPTKPKNCELRVFMPGEKIDQDYEVVGNFSVKDTGISNFCGWEKALEKNKERACEAGADAVMFLDIQSPSFWSSCYQSQANFLHFKSTKL